AELTQSMAVAAPPTPPTPPTGEAPAPAQHPAAPPTRAPVPPDVGDPGARPPGANDDAPEAGPTEPPPGGLPPPAWARSAEDYPGHPPPATPAAGYGDPRGGVATYAPQRSTSRSVDGRRAPLARAQGNRPGRQERHLGKLGKTVSALLATLIVVFLFGGGGYLASRQLYFLGTNPQGIVTVYRGLPYDLP